MDLRRASEWEEREAARVEAARLRQEELRQRLLNPKTRTAGRDVEGIAQQVAEKQASKQREKEEDRATAENIRRVQEALLNADLEDKKRRKEINREHLNHWTSEAERKADQKKKELVEYHAAPKNIGPSSAQRLDGEDHAASQRKELQMKQQRVWVQEQLEHKRKMQQAEQQERWEDGERIRLQKEAIEKAEKEALAARKKTLSETMQINQQLAESKKGRLEQEKEKSYFEETMEKQANLAMGDSCSPYSSQASALGPQRFRPDHYKGPSPEALEKFREEQDMHLEFRKYMKDCEEEAKWAQDRIEARMIQLANTTAMDELHRRRETERQVFEFQRRQAEERKLRKAQADHEKKNIRITDDFYSKFGTSHR